MKYIRSQQKRHQNDVHYSQGNRNFFTIAKIDLRKVWQTSKLASAIINPREKLISLRYYVSTVTRNGVSPSGKIGNSVWRNKKLVKNVTLKWGVPRYCPYGALYKLSSQELNELFVFISCFFLLRYYFYISKAFI